ncbi:MAG: hypothetical protein AAF985_03745, partial [Bacteroidota bacterium]
MKKLIQYIPLILLLILAHHPVIWSQQTPNCDDQITSPITDDMFSTEETSPCDPGGGVIFSYDDFVSSSSGTDVIFGSTICNLTLSPTNNGCNDVTTAILSNVYGDMSLDQLMECFDVLCSPQLDMAQDNFDDLQAAFETAASGQGVDIDAIIQEVEDEEGEETSQEEIEDYLEIEDGELDNLAQNLATGMGGLEDLQSIIETALDMGPSDCSGGSMWDGLVDDSDDPIPKTGNSSGSKSFIRKMEEKVEQMALEYFMNGNTDLGKDPNWFLGEVEGLGAAASGTKMPSPSATSTINSVSSGVNLYNGSASFNLPLDNISSKDVGVPIGISSQPGGLKVDDMESLAGSNMNLSAGGKVTRVVKGLPDEFYGDINGYAYGMKRGIKPVSEFLGVDVGVDIKKSMPRFIKKIVCRIIQYLIEELFDLNISGLCGDIADIVSGIGADIEADPATDVNLPGTSQLVENIKEKYGLREISAGANVKLDFSWKPLEFNYVNLDVIIIIPLFGAIDLVIIPKFRAGIKIVEVPSPVVIDKKGIGYNHLTNASVMGDLGLPTLDVNDFYGLSNEEKLRVLNKKQSTKKREDFGFFNPKANYFLEIMADFAQLFNTEDGEPYPVHNTEQLDLEPDEYHYEFGNYSGKFYFRPDGEIILVPYQDFEISTTKVLGKITSFTFLTPEGHQYVFAKTATSRYDHYSLPTSFRYEEIGTSRENFKKPVVAKVEYPTYKFWMGIPLFMEVKKDYMTNYYVEKGMTYNSAWHMTSVRSLTSQEQISVYYEDQDLQLQYNDSKNWTYAFPNFDVEGEQFSTIYDPDVGIHFKPTQWVNGFSELTYSMSEVFVTEPIVREINNHRGKKALFTYDLDNASLPGGKLCTRIEVQKNNNFYKAWELDYSSSSGTETTTSCDGTVPGEDGSVSPAYANDSEYKLEFDQSEKDPNDKFFYKFPVAVDILNGCIRFEIPIKLKFNINDKAPNGYYYMNSVSEFGSLMQLKTVLDIRDDQEQIRFNAEFARNFLRNVNEIDGADEAHNIAKVNYIGDLGQLPKRFSIHQDIWGYYNGQSTSMSPFIQEDYRYPDFHTLNPYHNTAHFAFKHPAVTDEAFDAGRNWSASVSNAIIGQIESIDLETGAFFQYDYDLQEYPLYTVSNGSSYENINNVINGQSGGLRIKNFTKGSGNGPTKKTTYRYRDPSVINLPMFMDYRGFSFVFRPSYKSKEKKITTSWKPTNIWQMNKNGYVGYGKVDELFDENLDDVFDNGKIIHQFTNPLMKEKDYELIEPASQVLYVKYNRIFKWGNENNIQTLATNNANRFDHHIKPKIDRSWRYGLEHKTKVLAEDGTLLQKTDTDYTFPTMDQSLKYPLSDMYQHLHYGSYRDFVDEGNLYNQIVDVGTRCMPHRFAQIIRFIVKHIITEHPYRYVQKWFPHSEIELKSEKVEMNKSITTNYFVDGNNKVTTTYTYHNNAERKIKEVTQSFSNGQSSGTEYVYADNFTNNNSNYPFIEEGIMMTMDQQLNYEVPVVKVTKLNGTPVSGSAINYFKAGSRYLPKTVWGIREGSFALTGIFDQYNSNGMVTNYRLAKYGTSTNAADYDFFPEFILTWNNNLLLETRTFGDFTTENVYDVNEDNLCLLESSIDANGLVTNYTFDDRRRLESIGSPGGLQTQTFTYNMNPLSTTTTTTFSD